MNITPIPHGRKVCRSKSNWLWLLSSTLICSQLLAQESDTEEDVFELSPFTVQPSTGYRAQSTLSGSRMNSELRNVSQSVSVMTESFLEDHGSLSPEDALLYSLNVENRSEFADPISANGNFNSGVAFNNFSGRVRGIDSAGRMRDFFNTNLQGDNYALGGGVSVSSGPNAVIFGLGGTGGVVSTSYKRAMLNRDQNGINLRTDSEGSFRATLDVNRVILEDKLAFRFIALNDDFETYRSGSEGDQERYFYSVTANPWEGGALNLYFEDVDIHKGLPRNLVAYDGGISLYQEHLANGGDPYYDNSPDGVNDPAWDDLVQRNFQNRDYWYQMPDGTQVFAGRHSQGGALYSVQTLEPRQLDASPLNDYRWSLPEDSEVVTLEHNVHGLTTNRRMEGYVQGAIFSQKLRENLHIELGYNFENGMTHYTSMAQPGAAVIRVDTNMYLPDRETPNPYKGMAYVDHWGQSTSDFNELESFRATVGWDLDFYEQSKWLGRHKVMALYTEDQIDRMWSWLRTKTIHPDDRDSYKYSAFWNRGAGQTYYRWYLDENYEMVNSFEPFLGGEQPDGSFVYARGNAPASGFTWSQLKKEKGATMAVQSFLLDERLVTTLGYRQGWFQDGSATVPIIRNTDEVAWGRANIEDIDRSQDTYNEEYSEDAINYGAVFHLTARDFNYGQFSLFYNFADIFTSPTPSIYPDGTRTGSPTGESYDVGIRWESSEGKYGAKLSYYETEASSLRSTQWQSYIKNPVRNIEHRIGFPGENPEEEDSHAERIAAGEIVDADGNVVTVAEINANPSLAFNTDDFDITTPNSIHGMTADRVSTGYEFEGWANPTENITIRLTAAINEATDRDMMRGWDTWIEKRYDYWKAWAEWEHEHYVEDPTEDPLSESGGSVTNHFASVSPGYSTLTTIDGARVNQNAGLRLNATGKYSFKEGALKGFEIGGTYRYREAPVVGYIASPAENFFPDFPYPGDDIDFTAWDLDKPVLAPDRNDFDMFMSYRGQLNNGTRYTVRLNVRNVFDNTDIQPRRARTDGEVSIYGFNAPRSYSMALDLRF